MDKTRKKHALLLLIPFGVLVDQVTKVIAENFLSQTGSVSIIDGFFSFTLAYNTGAAWGLFSGERWFLIGVPILIIIASAGFYFKNKKTAINVGLIIVITGAIGNLIDRVRTGEVIDFLDFIVFGYDFPVFNFADMCITLGCIYLIIYTLFEKEDHAHE